MIVCNRLTVSSLRNYLFRLCNRDRWRVGDAKEHPACDLRPNIAEHDDGIVPSVSRTPVTDRYRLVVAPDGTFTANELPTTGFADDRSFGRDEFAPEIRPRYRSGDFTTLVDRVIGD